MISRSSRNLGLLWVGQFVSQAGDVFFDVTLPFLILYIGGTSASAKSGVVMLFHFLPFLVLGPFAGALADRVDQRRLLLASDLARAALVLVLPIAFLAGHLSWPLVGAVAFLLATAASAFSPARDALLPRLAEGRSLVSVNAFFQTSIQLAYISGTLAVGFLVGDEAAGAEGIVRLYWFDAASFAFSFLTIAAIALAPGAAATERPRTSALADVAEGVRHALGSPLLAGLLFLTALDNFFIMGPAILGATLYVKDTLGLGPRHLAWFEAALGAGWLLGSLTVLRFGRGRPKGRLVLVGVLLDGATFVPFFWIRSLEAALAMAALHGFWIPFIQIGRTTLVQENVPGRMLGRVFSLINLTFVGFTGLSLLATGALGEVLDPPAIFLAGGAGGVLTALGGCAFRTLRRSR